MAQATEDQHRQLAAFILVAGKRQGWDKDKLQVILDLPPAGFNGLLTTLINTYGVPAKPEPAPEPAPTAITPLAGPLVLPKTFDPAKFIGDGYTIWKGPMTGDGLTGDEEQDPRSLALTEVDFRTLTKEGNFLTGLEGSETVITGEAKRARLSARAVQADARIGQALYEEEGQITLRWLFDALGIYRLELMGTVLREYGGNCLALCLYRLNNGSWYWASRWIKDDRGVRDLALSLASTI